MRSPPPVKCLIQNLCFATLYLNLSPSSFKGPFCCLFGSVACKSGLLAGDVLHDDTLQNYPYLLALMLAEKVYDLTPGIGIFSKLIPMKISKKNMQIVLLDGVCREGM